MNRFHIKIFLRNILNSPFNSTIKALGLTIGFISVYLIYAFVNHEMNFDKNFVHSDRIFRVVRNWQESKDFSASTPVPLLSAMKMAFPEIETGTRLINVDDMIILYNKQVFHEDNILIVDSTFFRTFNMELVKGNPVTALSKPGSMAVSRETAARYFGNEEPLGKVVKFEGAGLDDSNNLFEITGIFDDFPSGCHLKSDLLVSLHTFGSALGEEPRNHQLVTYLRLHTGNDQHKIAKNFPGFMEDFYGSDYYNYAKSEYRLQPVESIHLDKVVKYYGYETDKGNISNIYIFPVLGLLILLIAIINYINLSIAEGKNKSVAFAIYKMSGAGKYYFYNKYIPESLFFCLIALTFSIFVILIIFPGFEKFVNRDITIDHIKNLFWILLCLVVVVFVGIINGVFPAFVYSYKKGTYALLKKNNLKSGDLFDFNIATQIIQFSICILLIAGSIIVFKQLTYISHRVKESLSIENILIIKNPLLLGGKQQIFKEELKKIPGIVNVSLCEQVPGIQDYSHWGHPIDSAASDAHIVVYKVDEDYLNTLNINLTTGRFFDSQFKDDSYKVVLNETAVRTLGWDDPVGKRYGLDTTYSVIGVVKDIHYISLHYPILPQGYFLVKPEYARRILVKLNKENFNKSMADINRLWTNFVVDREMNSSFLDYEFNSWYKTERKTGIISMVLSAIAIFLSSLGLLSIVLHTIQRKNKEIGIRKVNGAGIISVMLLLNKGYLKLVLISFVIACPVVWYVMNNWLKNFEYKTDLSWWVFALAGIITMMIALLTVSWQSWKASSRNPVESLRYE